MQVVQQIASLAMAALHSAVAAGDELVAPARARRPGDLALEHQRAQRLLGGAGLQGLAQPALDRFKLCMGGLAPFPLPVATSSNDSELGGLGDRPHVAVFPPHLHESVVGHGVQRISVIVTGHFGIVTAAACWGGLRIRPS